MLTRDKAAVPVLRIVTCNGADVFPDVNLPKSKLAGSTWIDGAPDGGGGVAGLPEVPEAGALGPLLPPDPQPASAKVKTTSSAEMAGERTLMASVAPGKIFIERLMGLHLTQTDRRPRCQSVQGFDSKRPMGLQTPE